MVVSGEVCCLVLHEQRSAAMINKKMYFIVR